MQKKRKLTVFLVYGFVETQDDGYVPIVMAQTASLTNAENTINFLMDKMEFEGAWIIKRSMFVLVNEDGTYKANSPDDPIGDAELCGHIYFRKDDVKPHIKQYVPNVQAKFELHLYRVNPNGGMAWQHTWESDCSQQSIVTELRKWDFYDQDRTYLLYAPECDLHFVYNGAQDKLLTSINKADFSTADTGTTLN